MTKKAQEAPFEAVVPRRGARHRATMEQREAARDPIREEGKRRLTRSRKRTEDRFHINRSVIPEGMSYEWKRMSAYGKPDIHHQNSLMDNHWSPVPADRHPNLVVEQDGQILMERPSYLSDEARQEDFDVATSEVQRVTKGLLATPDNTMTRNHESVQRITKVNRERDLAITSRADGTLVVPEH